MSLLDKVRQLLQEPAARYGSTGYGSTGYGSTGYGSTDRVPARQAGGSPPAEDQTQVERYRYLLRTSTPAQLEEVHTEAFARLTPSQRRQVLEGLAADVPISERVAAADDPRSLARMATRAEVRRPGSLERAFGGGGVTTGGALVGGLLAGVATAVVGSVLVDSVFDTGLGDSGLVDLGHDEELFGFGGADGFGGGFDF